MSKSKAGKAEGGGGGSLVWLQGLACGAMAALAPATAVLLATLLAPGLVALMMDRSSGRPIARAMLLCSVAASVEPVRLLWRDGQGAETAIEMVTDWRVLSPAWMAAAVAWLLAEIVPIGVRLVLDAGSVARAARLRAARDKLNDEWAPAEADHQ